MKSRITALIQIIINLCLIPIYSWEIFFKKGVSVGTVVNGQLTTVIQDIYTTPYRQLADLNSAWLMYGHFAIIAVSVAASVVHVIKKDSHMAQFTANCWFVGSLPVFAVSMIVSTAAFLAH